jgi:autotransporter-associated beta strand protein
LIALVGNLLITGANNLSTVFSGTIEGGSLQKIGTGILMLTSANTYTGGTTIEGGKLVVNNRTGSGTGSGAVQVNAGILAGRGTIAGAVIVGTGGGAGAALAPGRRGTKTDTLTILSALTFQLDSTYKFELKASSGNADKVVANGVTINSGALFSFTDLGSAMLPTGTVFTAIDNTAATPIAGTFANLADGGIVTINGNNFQASYEGGDGNDLTLTVVP